MINLFPAVSIESLVGLNTSIFARVNGLPDKESEKMDEYNIAKILVWLNFYQQDNNAPNINQEDLNFILSSCRQGID